MIMLFSMMPAMPWSCYFPWRPCHDHAIFHDDDAMITPCRLWITMMMTCHNRIVMFEHGCQSRSWLTNRLKNSGLFYVLFAKNSHFLSSTFTCNIFWTSRTSVINFRRLHSHGTSAPSAFIGATLIIPGQNLVYSWARYKNSWHRLQNVFIATLLRFINGTKNHEFGTNDVVCRFVF